MTKPNDPAVPIAPHDKVATWLWTGLTKREIFAALAMQGFAQYQAESPMDESVNTVAHKAIRLADALIEELNNKKQCKCRELFQHHSVDRCWND